MLPKPYAIETDEPIPCAQCGKLNACKRFGPNAELVCYPCALMDHDAMVRGVRREMLGEGST